jgi:CBS domain-containing protein
MTTHGATRERPAVPVTVRPGLGVSVVFVVVLLAVSTLPDAVPDRPALAYLSGGVIGAGLLVGALLAADLIRARVASRSGATVKGIMIGAFGSRLVLVRPGPNAGTGTGTGSGTGSGADVGAYADRLAVDAKIGRAGLVATAAVGAVLTVLGVFAPAGTFALIGQIALWVGSFVLLVTLAEALPSPQTSGGHIVAAAVARRTGSSERGEAAAVKAGAVTGWLVIGLGVAALFFIGFVAMWVILFGWLTVFSSRMARLRHLTSAAIAGLSVNDVMGAPPPVLSAWQTVADALADVAMPSRRSLFVVEDFDGSLGGVARLRDLARVPVDERASVRVQRVAVPMAQVATAQPADPLAEAVGRLGVRPSGGVVLVLDDSVAGTGAGATRNRVVGVVGPNEINRAVESGPLGAAERDGVSST